MSRIPTLEREKVTKRDGGRCGRCGARGTEISHRRTRSVADEHQHCTCNMIRSCFRCAHDVAHGQPNQARSEGWVISRFEQRAPFEQPVLYRYMWTMLDCQGGIRIATTEEIERFKA